MSSSTQIRGQDRFARVAVASDILRLSKTYEPVARSSKVEMVISLGKYVGVSCLGSKQQKYHSCIVRPAFPMNNPCLKSCRERPSFKD